MKRMLMVAVLCATAVASLSLNTQAQGKKKGKEPELAICKRGKLIFEDDFSGKELEDWLPRKSSKGTLGEWVIWKGALCSKTRSSETPDRYLSVARDFFPPHQDIVVEFKANMETNAKLTVTLGSHEGGSLLFEVAPCESRFALQHSPGPNQVSPLAGKALRYQKRDWLDVVVETLGSRCALSVAGKHIEADHELAAKPKPYIAFSVRNQQSPPFLVDDVKVYEAIPKDQGEDKDEKGKKGK